MNRIICLAVIAMMASACTGRFVGGGSLVNGGSYSIQNVATADCFENDSDPNSPVPGQDGIPDTYSGAVNYANDDGTAFTCQIVDGCTIQGLGDLIGVPTDMSADLAAATGCEIQLIDTGWQTANQKGFLVFLRVVDENGNTLFSDETGVENGNISFHRSNNKGLCNSHRTKAVNLSPSCNLPI